MTRRELVRWGLVARGVGLWLVLPVLPLGRRYTLLGGYLRAARAWRGRPLRGSRLGERLEPVPGWHQRS